MLKNRIENLAKDLASKAKEGLQKARQAQQARVGSLARLEQQQIIKPGDEELPVVARLVVEIRSDGSRTIARGGLDDVTLGQKLAIDARGDTPLALVAQLSKSLLTAPLFAAQWLNGLQRENEASSEDSTVLPSEKTKP